MSVCAFFEHTTMTNRIKDVLRTLDQFQIKIGFENFSDDDAVSIFDCEKPFVIKKMEWKKALMWGMDMPSRAIGEWWNDFVELGYLQMIQDKEPQAWLQISLIKRDIEEFHGGIEDYIGGE